MIQVLYTSCPLCSVLEFKFINEEYTIKLSDPPHPPPLFWLGCATQKADLGASLPRFRY